MTKKLNDNMHFSGDSLLKKRTALLGNLINDYQLDTGGIIAYEDSTLSKGFEGIKTVGDINGNKITDTVLVLPIVGLDIETISSGNSVVLRSGA